MIYFDNASTTKTSEIVNNEIALALEKDYFNPSSLHTFGFEVSEKIQKARKDILNAIGGSGYGLVFTGSATEANNMALIQCRRGKILVGAGEHPSVLEKAKQLKNEGRDVEFVGLDKTGCVDIEALKKMLSADVGLVSVQYVSNETGAINNIGKIVELVKRANPRALVHVDMVQALGKIPVDLGALGVDMASFSGHKIHGPKGIGALAFASKMKLQPLVFGGGQEFGMRSGTENVPYILAFRTAVVNAVLNQKQAFDNAAYVKSRLIDGFNKAGLKFAVHGNGSPFVLSVSFDGVRGETLMHALEEFGIVVSTGSACSSKKVGNHTLEAMGQSKDEILENVRISFAHEKFDDKQIDEAIARICQCVLKLRIEK